MKSIQIRPFGVFLLLSLAVPAVLAACGGGSPAAATTVATATVAPAPSPSATPTAALAPTVVATLAPTVTATAAPTVVATATAGSPTVPAGNGLSAQLEQGKLIFEKTAGGVGCAFCHNIDGKGKGPANVDAPNIRGKTEADVRAAVAGGVPMMTIVKLSDDEYEAVAAYLAYLGTQP